MANYTIGQQPCNNYIPQMEANEYATWANVHDCYCGHSKGKRCEGMVSFCENCNSDHHSNGYESCQCGGKGKVHGTSQEERKEMSKPEEQLAFQLKAAHIEFEREYRPWKDRRFRFDFYISILQGALSTPEISSEFLIEVQGGIWMPKFGKKSGHTTGVGINNNCEKYCLAAIDGYLVMPVTPDQIKSGKALQWIEKAIGRG